MLVAGCARGRRGTVSLAPDEHVEAILASIHDALRHGRSVAPTDHLSVARFHAHWSRPGWFRSQPMSTTLELLDPPGASLFPPRGEPDPAHGQEVTRALAAADSIWVTVDASSPRGGDLGWRLPLVLGRLPAGDRQIVFVLTKLDRLLHDLDGSGMSAAEVAARLDPVHTACELLGEEMLESTLTALGGETRLSIALTSAWGFGSDGGPLMERLSDHPRGWTTAEAVFDHWKPWGTTQLVDHVLAGTDAPGVARVDTDSLARSRRARRVARPLRRATS